MCPGVPMFVVSGEALMDVFAVGDTPTGVQLDARVGGSPFNVAVGLARLGQPVALLAGLSTGFLGQRLMRALQDEGVLTDCVTALDAPTTISLIGLDERGIPSYSFYGQGAADRSLPLSALSLVPASVRAFHFGSYAMVVDPVATTLRALVERECGRALISFDPNVRLNVEPRLEPWREVLRWMLPRAHLLKISDEDLELIDPGREPADFAAEAIACGTAAVVVTRGARGAMGWTANGSAEVASRQIVVVDTVGAGDTFQAAMLAWLSEQGRLTPDGLRTLPRQGLGSMLSFAADAASITCSRQGANLPRRAELRLSGDARGAAG